MKLSFSDAQSRGRQPHQQPSLSPGIPSIKLNLSLTFQSPHSPHLYLIQTHCPLPLPITQTQPGQLFILCNHGPLPWTSSRAITISQQAFTSINFLIHQTTPVRHHKQYHRPWLRSQGHSSSTVQLHRSISNPTTVNQCSLPHHEAITITITHAVPLLLQPSIQFQLAPWSAAVPQSQPPTSPIDHHRRHLITPPAPAGIVASPNRRRRVLITAPFSSLSCSHRGPRIALPCSSPEPTHRRRRSHPLRFQPLP
ncbi:hypothetical protein M0R45_026497 [Rubus argutus]|uniref:Uncharacterized protein n=1 Tax=Rubus argutus TaxID=59490 RepID=A0AAW1WZE3_RUBAR